MNRIVITGATGTIGLAFLNECIKRNTEVLALVNPGSSNIARIPASKLITVRECALQELADFRVSDAPYDAFIHLAWSSTNGDAARNCLQPQVMNIKYALDAVELAAKLGCKVFVGAGSQAEYGRTEEVLTEETAAKPETAYGMAKLCCGQMTRLACRQKGIRHIWPRILSTYGPGSQPQTIINYAVTQLLRNQSPSLTKCEQIWDFIYVSDAAKALLALAEKGKDGEIYVIGSGKARPLQQYMMTLKDVLEQETGEKLPPLGFGEKDYSDTTVMHLECSISKLSEDTGFQPQISFEEGIRHTMEWCRQFL